GRLLGWKPEHSLRETLPRMIAALKADPVGWYQANKLNVAKAAGKGTTSPESSEALHASREKTGPGMMEMAGARQRMLWAHFLVLVLGIWLLTSPVQFALFHPATASCARYHAGTRAIRTRIAQCAYGVERHHIGRAVDTIWVACAVPAFLMGAMGLHW